MDNSFWIWALIIVGIVLFVKNRKEQHSKKKPHTSLEVQKHWEVQKQLLTEASKNSFKESVTIWPNWPNILERVLGIPSGEILQRFASVGLKYKGIEELLAPGLHAIEGATFTFDSWHDVKSGMMFSTITMHNLHDPNSEDRRSETHNTAGPLTSRLFNETIRDFVWVTRNSLSAKQAGLSEGEMRKREEALTRAGLNRDLLLGQISFDSDGSIATRVYDEIGALGDNPEWAFKDHETVVRLPIGEMRILAATGDPLFKKRLGKRDMGRYYELLTGNHRAVTALDVLEPRLSELGLELKPQEDEWRVYGNGDSFHSKYGTIIYEHELFFGPEDLWVINEKPSLEVIKGMMKLAEEAQHRETTQNISGV